MIKADAYTRAIYSTPPIGPDNPPLPSLRLHEHAAWERQMKKLLRHRMTPAERLERMFHQLFRAIDRTPNGKRARRKLRELEIELGKEHEEVLKARSLRNFLAGR